jgi:hypothetical protein
MPPANSLKTRSDKGFARLKWALGAALLAMLGTGTALIGSGGTAAVAKALQDPLSLLADRSPGSRPEGALLSTKRAKAKALDPVELVLPGGRTRAPVAEDAAPEASLAEPAADPLLAVAATELPLPFSTPEAAPLALVSGAPPYLGGAPGPGILIPIGDLPPIAPPGPSGPGTPPDCCSSGTPPDTPPPVTTAVPEPGTWVMLILGFFLVGGSLRAATRRAAAGRSMA